MDDDAKQQVVARIHEETTLVQGEIAALKKLVKPIPPDNAIGRLTRMEAIQAKSINEAVLRKAELRLQMLEAAAARSDSDSFGYCAKCDEPIPIKRLLFLPESTRCVNCAS